MTDTTDRPDPEPEPQPEARDPLAFLRLFEGVRPSPPDPSAGRTFEELMQLMGAPPSAPVAPAEPTPAQLEQLALARKLRDINHDLMRAQQALAEMLMAPPPPTDPAQGRTEKWFSPAPAEPAVKSGNPAANGKTKPRQGRRRRRAGLLH